MTNRIRRVAYFYATAKDKPGEAYQLLSQLAAHGVNLLAFSTIPTGPTHTQLMLFPEEPDRLLRASDRIGVSLIGPQHAFLVQGADELGALAELHRQLRDANVNVYASSGVTDGHGRYGYILYVRPEHYETAAQVLGA